MNNNINTKFFQNIIVDILIRHSINIIISIV